jgi:hypothetical protein
MMLQMQGTGALLVLILMAIAAIMVVLLLVGMMRGSIKPKPGWLSVGVVIVALTVILGLHRSSGGAFPKIIWGRTVRQIRLHKISVVPESHVGNGNQATWIDELSQARGRQ